MHAAACSLLLLLPLAAWEWEWDNQVIERAFVPTASYPEQLHSQRAHGGLKNGCRTNKNS
jgi:hypothetical protein